MYSNLRSRVRVINNNVTTDFKCNIGTRQGDVTSTIIFNLLVNELSLYLRDRGHQGIFITEDILTIQCILFADNVANCYETAIELQRQLNSIFDFCKISGVTVNEKKTEVILFRNGGPLRSYKSWFYNENPVNVTSVYKYMGLLFTPKLSWPKAKAKLAMQAKQSINAIKSYQGYFGKFDI